MPIESVSPSPLYLLCFHPLAQLPLFHSTLFLLQSGPPPYPSLPSLLSRSFSPPLLFFTCAPPTLSSFLFLRHVLYPSSSSPLSYLFSCSSSYCSSFCVSSTSSSPLFPLHFPTVLPPTLFLILFSPVLLLVLFLPLLRLFLCLSALVPAPGRADVRMSFVVIRASCQRDVQASPRDQSTRLPQIIVSSRSLVNRYN